MITSIESPTKTVEGGYLRTSKLFGILETSILSVIENGAP